MEIFYTIEEGILTVINYINGWLWGIPLIILLFGSHLFLTYKTGFVQRYVFKGIKLSVQAGDKKGGDISNFGALALSTAATIGTGNIVGVGVAIVAGGPGAVLWCWLTGLFGIATKYAESLVAVKYRTKTSDGSMMGGAMVVLDKVLKQRWLAIFFCIATILAAFGIGNMVQSNAATELLQVNFSIEPYITGLILSAIVAITMLGGVKSLANVSTLLVPIMAVGYILGCVVLLIFNFSFIDDALVLIFKSAFAPQAIAGGVVGGGLMIAMRSGMSRGLFSNESGMGSAPIVAAAAQTPNAVKQALIASTATFWDTVVICALTGLVLVSSLLAFPNIDITDGSKLVNSVFAEVSSFGSSFLSIALLAFVFSTILGWSYYAERCIEYLFDKKYIIYYRIVWVILIFVGAVAKIELVWAFSDMANALMAIPNIIAVLMLSGIVAKETKKYLSGKNANIDEIDDELER